ncbi:leucine-rich repeat-containing protein 34 isoform X2 [Cynoglossus semilaevis]|uniref:leucine-rich repeat-containing protein 34 isoform X2 n=1 Tax=Cynoglossus semilaevis TaxID=244447 RepID=UPI0007DCA8C9|nr:leucine-rich repeat-containing protein 34 isoform X2 [Cynoglossus semilaevis]
MAENICQFYREFCAENQIKTNPYILQILQERNPNGEFALKLRGNQRLRQVQRLSDDDVLVLCKSLQRLSCVTDLDIKFNNITNAGITHLAELLQENSRVRTLDLSFNDILTHGAETLSRSLKSNHTLLSLRLSGNKIGNEGSMHMASLLQVNDTLEELELSDCDLVNTHTHTHHEPIRSHHDQLHPAVSQATQSVTALAIALKNNPALRCIDISRPLLFSHQEEWAEHWANMLALNSSLVELHLGKTGLTDTGTEKLTRGLRFNHSLRYLDLRCNHVTRDGVHHLTKMLRENQTLELIDLSSNRIEDEGAEYLSEAITSPGCSLKELSVKSNNITTQGLLALTRAIKANTTLTHIYVWGNHLEEPVCKAFRELVSSNRLQPHQTDVSAYEVDGQVFLAEASHCLRRHFYSLDDYGTNTQP